MLGTATVATGLLTGPSAADPRPSIDEVEKEVEKLERAAEKAAEASNEKRDEVRDLRGNLKKLDSDLDNQQARVDELQESIGAYAAAEYRTGGTDPTVQLLMSENPDEFLDQMNSSRALQGQQGDALRNLQAEQKELDERRSAQDAQLARLKEAKKDADSRLQEAEAKWQKAEALLERLTAEEQERLREERASRGGDRDGTPPPPPPDGSGRGAVALQFAQAQIGEPYVFGASGPDSWDCSGLTMAAWGEAGVSLSHSSRSQAAEGTPVSRSALQPGDLIIYYSDMHHVGIYAGGGQVVHAPRPGKSVEYIGMDVMPIAAMVRPG